MAYSKPGGSLIRAIARMIVGGGLKPLGYEQITSISSAKTLTVPNGAIVAMIQAEAKDGRWRDDGTNPTSAEGHLANVGTVLVLDNRRRLEQFRAIRTGATSATLRVTYQR